MFLKIVLNDWGTAVKHGTKAAFMGALRFACDDVLTSGHLLTFENKRVHDLHMFVRVCVSLLDMEHYERAIVPLFSKRAETGAEKDALRAALLKQWAIVLKRPPYMQLCEQANLYGSSKSHLQKEKVIDMMKSLLLDHRLCFAAVPAPPVLP